jgi:uncharacterized protein
MTNSATPVLQKERSDILDVLRGLALLGVMIDNLFGFTGWVFLSEQQRTSLATWPADGIIGALEQIFINGKFYSLFSLLFGIGFSIILIRNEQRGINPLKIFYRRLFILLIIGAAHIFLLWEGDILFLYALLGLLLPLFRKCSDKTLLIAAIAFILSPVLLDVIYILLHAKSGDTLESLAISIDKTNGLPLDTANYADYLYKNGGWQEWRNWQASGWAYRYSYILDSNRIPKVLGMFLLGFYTGRKMMYVQLANYSNLFKKLRFWGLIVGIPACAATFYFEFFQNKIPDPVGLFHSVFYAVGVVPLSLAYTSIVCLHWIKKKDNSALKYLAPVGRMALTNYIMQTVIAIIIYYGVGFGMGGNIGPAIFIPIGICVYCFQILYSNIWFNYFNYGPLEWIWRQLTYRKKLPIRKQA